MTQDQVEKITNAVMRFVPVPDDQLIKALDRLHEEVRAA